MDHVTEIKNRLPIEQLVGQYVQLKKVGRHFKALCPFHKERTPSFYVSPERQMAYCFGCKKGGDHFKFIQEMEGLDFVGALKMLAERAGVVLPERNFSPEKAAEHVERASQRDRLIAIHEHATHFFEDELFNSSDGKKVLGYLKKRGLTEETIKKARLGFAGASDSERLYKHLLEKGYSRTEILASGLAMARDTTGSEKCVDRFRMRLMFPIQNLTGAVCAFGGRAVKDGDEPKYLNSPETPIYRKSSLLYGLAESRAAIRTGNFAIIVEGYMDVLSVRQAGIANVIASSGTALTEDQLMTLKRFTKEIIFALDRDTAGKLATERAIELGFAKDFLLRVAVWKSDAKDPDECIRSKPEIFEDAVKNALPATDYLLRNYVEQFGKDSGAKKKIVDALLPFLSKIGSPVELDEWIKKCANEIGLSYASFYDEVKRFSGKQKLIMRPKTPQDVSDSAISLEKNVKIEEYLLGLILTYPETLSIANQLVGLNDFENIELQNIYRSLGTQYNQSLGDLSNDLKEKIDLLRMYAETRHAEMQWAELEDEVKKTAAMLRRQRSDREKRSIVTRLRTAEGKEKEKLMDEMDALNREENLKGII